LVLTKDKYPLHY